ncbi:hypothetical protein OVA24_06245 [Luteolibacter sp. SL250]|uniref:hypothetical protein n=1 Tax=Luteolibacter sp. SL250 TaxID=2995170 RepID=UPI00226D6C12|nr:hypothetical protein [Luteolibacter sp. SL250]WAC20981.1 hypothetical protein OVA24_06245 [Luteolibacter sp. SL250]
MIDFTTERPLEDAVARLGKRTPLGATLSSAEWSRVPWEIREVSFFSAHVECERLLAIMQGKILRRVRLEKEKLANGEEITMDRGRFIAEMQDELHALGYQPKPADQGTVRDLSSAGRLGLIWDMQLGFARGYANWKASFDPDLIEAAPCWELIREADREVPRAWVAEIWPDHGGKFYGGRMIALKSDPIWKWISDFGVPWPPFKWGSGMGVKNVRWREARELGVPGIDDPQEMPDMDLASGVQASRKNLPQVSEDRLRSEFGDTIQFDQDKISFHPTHDADEQSISQQLTSRARAIADAGRDQILRSRSEDDAAAWPSGFDSGEYDEEILASTSAVAVGRKALYHDEWGSFAAAFANLIRDWLPDNVMVRYLDGHVYAWRRDLLKLRPDEIHALSAGLDPQNGVLLGYGQNLGDEPFSTVTLKIGGRVVGGFSAPRGTAKVYASARAKDFSDATGEPVSVHINGEEVAL